MRRRDWFYLLAIIAVLLVGWAVLVPYAFGSSRTDDTKHIPYVFGNTTYAPRPASLPIPAGYRCFQQSSEYVRYGGYFYGHCTLNQPGGSPSGVLVYRSLDGSSSEVVLATGRGSGEGSLTVDTDGALILSTFVVSEQRQYLDVVATP